MLSMPTTKTAFLSWKQPFMSGNEARTQREGREKEGLNSLSIYPLACISARKKSGKKTDVMQDGIPESHKWLKYQQSIPACVPWKATPNASRLEKSVSLTANLLLLWWKNRHRGQVLPGNHISGRQFIRYQRENEYNKGLVRKDSNREGKSHRDTTAEGQFPLLIPAGKFLAPRSSFVCLP